jgi:hypothetical protein
MYKIGKTGDPILIDKRLIQWIFFIWDKEIQIWINKGPIMILEGLINFIEDLIARKIDFLKSIWVLVRRNWSLESEIELWKV